MLRGEGRHLQRDALPQFLCLLSSFQVLQYVVELHHADGRQAESAPSAANDVDKIVIVGGGKMNKSVVDVLRGVSERRKQNWLNIISCNLKSTCRINNCKIRKIYKKFTFTNVTNTA